DEVQALVAGQRTWQQPCFLQDLEAVADAQDWQATTRSLDDGAHGWRDRCDGTGAQVVAIRKPPGTTTASTSFRSASACHSSTGSPPARRTARRASTSSRVPGKVITPMRGLTAEPPR